MAYQLWLVAAAAAATAAWALPQLELKPSQILLSNLPSERLDELLDSRLADLQEYIEEAYENELRQYERNMVVLEEYKQKPQQKLQPQKPQAQAKSRVQRQASYYVTQTSTDYDRTKIYYNVTQTSTDYDRTKIYYNIEHHEQLEVESISVGLTLEKLDVSKVVAVNLWNLAAIYTNEQGLAFTLSEGRFQPLVVKQCGYQDHSCASNSRESLRLNAAAGFQYFLDYYDPKYSLQQILAVASGKSLKFYKVEVDGLLEQNSEDGLTTIEFDAVVTHIGYGEMYADSHDTVKVVRFLVVFRAGHHLHHFYGITISKHGTASCRNSGTWQSSGTQMQVWTSGGRVMVGVRENQYVKIYQVEIDYNYEYHIVYKQSLDAGAAIVAWRTFTMASEHYLVVTTRSHAVVYFHYDSLYRPIQNLLPPHGFSGFTLIIPHSTPWWRGQVVLVAGEGRRVVAYVWRGVEKGFQQNLEKTLAVAVTDWTISISHAEELTRTDYVFLMSGEGPALLNMTVRLELLPDPSVLKLVEQRRRLAALREEFERQENIIAKVVKMLEESVENSDVITGDVVVETSITVEETLMTEHLEAATILLELDGEGGVTHMEYQKYLEALAQLQASLDQINRTLSVVLANLNDAVPASGSSQLIGGVKRLVAGGLHVEKLVTADLTVTTPQDRHGNPFPLDQVLAGIVRQNDSRTVGGKKTFTGHLQIGNLVTDRLDDIPVSDLVTVDGDNQVITGTVTFTSAFMAEQIVLPPGGTVAGIDFSEQAVTLDGNAMLGHCSFTKGVVVENMVSLSKKINGVDIQRLSTSALTTSGGTILGSLVFTGSLSIHSLDAKMIMGVDTAQFMETTVFKNRPAVVKGFLTMPFLELEKDLTVEGLINGKSFPADYPLLTDDVPSFEAVRFMDVTFGSIDVGPSFLVDGLRIEDIVTLNTEQVIVATKRFARGVTIDADLDIRSKIIDGVNLDELFARLSHMNSSQFLFDVIFEQNVQAPSLDFGGTFNGINWNALMNDIVFTDEAQTLINSTKTFSELVINEAIFQSTFNGMSFTDFVTIDGSSERIIEGQKVFENGFEARALQVGSLGGINIESLVENAIYKDREGQILYGIITFDRTLSAKEFEVTGEIIGLDLSQVVTTNTDQTFAVPQSLNSANFTDLEVKSIEITNGFVINGIDFASLSERILSLSTQAIHTGVLTVDGSVTVDGPLQIGTLNGEDLLTLTDNLVMKEESSVITSHVIFEELVVKGPITTGNSAGANNLNISNIDLNAVKLAGDSVMTGAATWEHLVFQADVHVGGLVNGYKLSDLLEDLVLRDSTDLQEVTGTKIFRNGVTVKGNIEAGTVNGMDLRQKLLTPHTNQVITAPYEFQNLEAHGPVEILGLFNGKNITQLTSGGLLESGETITGNVTFYGGLSVGRLRIVGLYNGIDVIERMNDSIALDEVDVNLNKKIFKANVTFADLHVERLNMVPFDHYIQHVVLKSSNKNLTGRVRVRGTVFAPIVLASDTVIEGTIGGVDYNKLVKESLFLDRNYTLDKLIVKGNVMVHGDVVAETLNGLSLATQYLTASTVQTFPDTVTFASITTGDVIVHGLVNSVNLPAEVAVTMMAVGGQRVTGPLTLAGTVEVLNNVEVTGLVGTTTKIDLSQQVVRLDEFTKVEGTLLFREPLVVASLVSPLGIVNGFNLTDLLLNAWYLDKPAQLRASFIFTAEVKFKMGLIRGTEKIPLRLEDLRSNITRVLTRHHELNTTLSVVYDQTCSRVVPLYHHLEHAIYEPDYFTVEYEFELPFSRHASTAFTAFNMSFLVVSWEEECESVWYSLDAMTRSLKKWKITPWADQWHFLAATHDTAYVAMVASEGGKCGSPSTTVYKMTKTSVTVHKELEAGKSLSAFSEGRLVKLCVHTSHHTTIYILDTLTDRMTKYSEIRELFSHWATLLTTEGQLVQFRRGGKLGMLYVDGQVGETIRVEHSIDDCLLLQQSGGAVVLLLAVTREKMHKPECHLELYSVELTTRTLTWRDVHVMSSPVQLVAFFAGSQECGSYMVAALQQQRDPILYTVLGETLKEFGRLSTSRVSWGHHVSLPDTQYPHPAVHSLLLGQHDDTLVVARLVMKGGAVPPRAITCDLDDLSSLQWRPFPYLSSS